MSESSICPCCMLSRPKQAFLPVQAQRERQRLCIWCLRDETAARLTFLDAAVASPQPDAFLLRCAPSLREAGFQITCGLEMLADFSEVKAAAQRWGARTQARRQDKEGLWHIHFKCALDGVAGSTAEEGCAFSAVALEQSEDRAFQWQVLAEHSCTAGTPILHALWSEVDAFRTFVAKTETWLSPTMMAEVDAWPASLAEVNTTLKVIHEGVHAAEDAAVSASWEGPCRWRRMRGQRNEPPTLVDIQPLCALAIEHGCGVATQAYLDAHFHVEEHSTYFQQRGYFMLVALAPLPLLEEVLARRVQVLHYASRLLEDDLFLLCYKKLNPTVLRNHAWMVAMLYQALRFRQGHNDSAFPLFGHTSPKDSADPDLYQKLASL